MTPSDTKELIENSENLPTTYLGTRTSQLGVEENIGIADEKRLLHVLTTGPTGYGKTQLMVHAAVQDAAKGYGFCMIVPKGGAVNEIIAKLPEDRRDDVVYINPGRDAVTGLNVLEPYATDSLSEAQLENQKEIIVSDIIDLFKRQSENWGDRFGRVLETLLRAHLDRNIHHNDTTTLIDVFQCITQDRKLADLIDQVSDDVLRDDLVTIREELTDRELEPLQRRLQDFVENRTVRRVISVEESGVNFRHALNDGKIILVDIQKGEIGDTVATLVGSIVITKIWAAAQSRITQPAHERTPFYLYVDELQNFAGEGSNFTKILSEAREYKLGCWLATQYLHQLATEMRRAVANNCRTKIVFNPAGSEDETWIAGMLNDVSKQELKRLGKYRAVMQKPAEQEHQPAVLVDTYPPWTADRSHVDMVKDAGTHPTEATAIESGRSPSLGQGANAGGERHADLLKQAKQYFEAEDGVQVQLLYQDTGVEKPDGHIITDDGDIAHLEAEASTLSKPGRVLQNLHRAADAGNDCVFIVEQGNAAKLDNILADPVDRRGTTHEDENGTYDYYQVGDDSVTDLDLLRKGEYRIYEATEHGLRAYGSDNEAECPELEDDNRTELEAFCLHRDDSGFCEALEQPCVLTNP